MLNRFILLYMYMQCQQSVCFVDVFQCDCKSSESRTVICATKEGVVLSDDNCDVSRKPTTSRSCDSTTSIACELTDRRWYTSEWGEVGNIFVKQWTSRSVLYIIAEY